MRTIYPTTPQNGRTWKVVFVLLLICAMTYPLFHTTSSRAEITASASLNSATFPVDQHAQLSITVNGSRSANLDIPATKDFDIYQRGKSQQFKIINGDFSTSISISCIVQAHQPGKYTIPPITIHTDDATITTEAIPFEVTGPTLSTQQPAAAGSGQAVQSGNSSEKNAFIRLISDRKKSYIGEDIPVEIKAYFKQGLRANLNSTPALIGDGFVMPQLHDQPRQTQEYVGSTIYNVLSWQTTLSTIKEGSHTLHLELEATQLIPQRRTSTSIFGSRSPFDDDLFDSVFGGYAQKPLKVVSDDINMEVLPLPEKGRPDSFTGAIGEFTLKTSVTPTQVETGEPITLTITVSGTGNFDRVEAPAFPDLPEWKTYAPASQYSPDKTHNSTDQKTFEQAIVAQSPSIREVPSLSFSYFDPINGEYVTRESAPIPLSVIGKASLPPQPVVTSPPQPNPVETKQKQVALPGLAPLKIETGKAVKSIKPLYQKTAFLIFITCCLAAIFGFFILHWMQLRSEGNPEDRRKRQLSSALREAFTTIESAQNSGDGSAFLAACRAAIQQHLGTLWECEPTTITRANLANRLPQYPELLEIFTAAEQAAYGGARLSKETMENYTRNLKTTLEKLI